MPPHRRRLGPPPVATLVVAVALATACPRAARAQATPAPDAVAESRTLFQTGLAAFEQGRWDEARAAFARAYALYPRPLTLLDLAAAEAQSGQLLAAQEDYRRLVRQAAGDPSGAEYGAPASRALLDLERRVPRAQVAIAGLAAGDVARIDGRALGPAELARDVALDPGEHTLALERGGATVAQTRFTLAEGQLARVALEAPAAASAVRANPVVRPIDARRATSAGQTPHRGGSPWVAVGVVAAVAVVAAGAVTAVVLLTGSNAAFNGSPPVLEIP